MNTRDWDEWQAWIDAISIPSHLDRQAIIDNSLLNAADVPDDEQLACAKGTVEMYIDQDRSSF